MAERHVSKGTGRTPGAGRKFFKMSRDFMTSKKKSSDHSKRPKVSKKSRHQRMHPQLDAISKTNENFGNSFTLLALRRDKMSPRLDLSSERVEVSTNKKEKLTRILNNYELRCAFEKFLISQYCAENLYFWIAVEAYGRLPEDASDLPSAALDIYERFIESNCDWEINISDPERLGIKSNVEKGTIKPDLFDTVVASIVRLMYTDSLPKFLNSSLYRQTKSLRLRIKLPPVIGICLAYLDKNGLTQGDLFTRNIEHLADLADVQKKIETEDFVGFDNEDAYVVAALLIRFLREQDHPVIPYQYHVYFNIVLTEYPEEERVERVRELVHSLPVSSQAIVHKILLLLHRRCSHKKGKDRNNFVELRLTNDAHVFTMVLLRHCGKSENQVNSNNLLEFLIMHVGDIFSEKFEDQLADLKTSKDDPLRLYYYRVKDWVQIYSKHLDSGSVLSDQNKRRRLTSRDWELILSGASRKVYQKGDILVQPGQDKHHIYRIEKGLTDVLIKKGSTDRVIGQAGSMQVIGDAAVLGKDIPVDTTTVAVSDTVTVSVVSMTFLFNLFEAHPLIASRFYRQTAKFLSSLAINADNAKGDDTISRKPPNYRKLNRLNSRVMSRSHVDDIADAETDLWLQKKFELPSITPVIADLQCDFVRPGNIHKIHSHLYITKSWLCFTWSLFYVERKQIFDMSYISKISKRSGCSIVISVASRKAEQLLKTYKLGFASEKERDHIHKLIAELSLIASRAKQNQPKTTKVELFTEDGTGYQKELSADDWDIIMNGSEDSLLSYGMDEIVMKEGNHYNRMFQIVKGSCRIEREEGDQTTVLATLRPGDIFGEISFLCQCPATATVKANRDKVDLLVLDRVILNVIFYNDPKLESRFYRFVASLVAKRLHTHKSRRRSHSALIPRLTKTRHMRSLDDNTTISEIKERLFAPVKEKEAQSLRTTYFPTLTPGNRITKKRVGTSPVEEQRPKLERSPRVTRAMGDETESSTSTRETRSKTQ
eukprot:CAMPEP_0168528274 /NCGR_PEP_ID=MMETSP0405-20121227/13150_1 /TAXON_ID=498012 /ORGANISM="Trichosphaerium sp, Strain Am-I-7 wt" /LENGTH=995 /DNA_ID=CAMNT_0008551645 /DNA_START=77 /DNA_END=3064 /DNA_ORIENTATION=-